MAGKDERRKSPGAGEDPRRGDVPAKDKSAKRDVAPEKGSFADEAGSGAARAVPTHAAGAEGPVAEAAMDRRVIEDGELTERLMSADRDDRPVEGRTVTHEARQAQGAQEGPRAAAEAASYTPSRQLRHVDPQSPATPDVAHQTVRQGEAQGVDAGPATSWPASPGVLRTGHSDPAPADASPSLPHMGARLVGDGPAAGEAPSSASASATRVFDDGELRVRMMSADREERPVEGRTVEREARVAGDRTAPREGVPMTGTSRRKATKDWSHVTAPASGTAVEPEREVPTPRVIEDGQLSERMMSADKDEDLRQGRVVSRSARASRGASAAASKAAGRLLREDREGHDPREQREGQPEVSGDDEGGGKWKARAKGAVKGTVKTAAKATVAAYGAVRDARGVDAGDDAGTIGNNASESAIYAASAFAGKTAKKAAGKVRDRFKGDHGEGPSPEAVRFYDGARIVDAQDAARKRGVADIEGTLVSSGARTVETTARTSRGKGTDRHAGDAHVDETEHRRRKIKGRKPADVEETIELAVEDTEAGGKLGGGRKRIRERLSSIAKAGASVALDTLADGVTQGLSGGDSVDFGDQSVAHGSPRVVDGMRGAVRQTAKQTGKAIRKVKKGIAPRGSRGNTASAAKKSNPVKRNRIRRVFRKKNTQRAARQAAVSGRRLAGAAKTLAVQGKVATTTASAATAAGGGCMGCGCGCLPILLVILIVLALVYGIAGMIGGMDQDSSEGLEGNWQTAALTIRLNTDLDNMHIAAILGNMRQECGDELDPTALEEPSLGIEGNFSRGDRGVGICQWTTQSEKQGLLAKAEEMGSTWDDLEVQIAYLCEEMMNPNLWGSGTTGYILSAGDPMAGQYVVVASLNQYLNATELEDCVTTFCYGYLRPGIPRQALRVQYAWEFYGQLEDEDFGGMIVDGASSATQQAVVNACYSTPSPGSGLCAMWVSQVFANAGLPYYYGNANDMYWSWCTSSDRSTLKPGMIVAVPRWSGTSAGQKYGHVCIYIGGGMVMDNIGSVRTTDLESWLATYGDMETPMWGWIGGVDLSAM